MIENFKPDMYIKSIYDLDYKKLKNMGIKCILVDLDNTIACNSTDKPSRKAKDFIELLKSKGFNIIIFSNATKKRLIPFKDKLEVDCACKCNKPSKLKYKKILKEFKYGEDEVASVGDQLITDVFGGNRVGIFTILVDPISKHEPFGTKIFRTIERVLFRRLKSKGLLIKGKYYE